MTFCPTSFTCYGESLEKSLGKSLEESLGRALPRWFAELDGESFAEMV